MSKAVVVQEQVQNSQSLKDYLNFENIDSATTHCFILCSVLVVLQILDALLTIAGINAFGIHAEGNPILFFFMERFGALTTIVVAKSLAVAVIGLLFILSAQVTWVPKALYGVIAIYICCAVIPWSCKLLKNALLL